MSTRCTQTGCTGCKRHTLNIKRAVHALSTKQTVLLLYYCTIIDIVLDFACFPQLGDDGSGHYMAKRCHPGWGWSLVVGHGIPPGPSMGSRRGCKNAGQTHWGGGGVSAFQLLKITKQVCALAAETIWIPETTTVSCLALSYQPRGNERFRFSSRVNNVAQQPVCCQKSMCKVHL